MRHTNCSKLIPTAFAAMGTNSLQSSLAPYWLQADKNCLPHHTWHQSVPNRVPQQHETLAELTLVTRLHGRVITLPDSDTAWYSIGTSRHNRKIRSPLAHESPVTPDHLKYLLCTQVLLARLRLTLPDRTYVP